MATEVTPDDVDELPQQDEHAERINPTLRAPGPVPLLADDVDTLPPGLMRKHVPTPAKPTPEHRDRLSRALRDLDQWRARRGEYGAEWTARKTGKTHRVGDRVSVNGHTGTIVRKHESSGLPVIEWDK